MRRRLPKTLVALPPAGRRRAECESTACPPEAVARCGFTLIELMVVLVVLAILTTIALVAVNATVKADKVSGPARSVQSFFEGARDRALHDRLPRGVRFFPHPNDSNIYTSYQYVGPAGILSEGTVQITANTSGQPRVVTPTNAALWERLHEKGILLDGARIKIDVNFYTIVHIHEVDTNGDGMPDPDLNGNGILDEFWQLTKDFAGTAPTGPLSYELTLGPAVLPNQERRELPAGVVIDRAASRLPPLRPDGSFDVLFTPQGMIIGDAARSAHVHLVFRGQKDFDERPGATGLANALNEDEEYIVTVTTRTGSVSTHSVYSTADPFRNAETGVESE